MTFLNAFKADPDQAALLLIDFQTKLLPEIHDAQATLVAAGQLLAGAHIFSLPILVTEQYRRGLGPTHPYLADQFAAYGVQPLEKMTFSCCGDDSIRDRLNEQDKPQVLVAGIETHVCVSQTVLDLLAMEFQVFVCSDAVSSRRPHDARTALTRMRECGATITTVESILFELCHASGTDTFKRLLPWIKDPTGGRRLPTP